MYSQCANQSEIETGIPTLYNFVYDCTCTCITPEPTIHACTCTCTCTCTCVYLGSVPEIDSWSDFESETSQIDDTIWDEEEHSDQWSYGVKLPQEQGDLRGEVQCMHTHRVTVAMVSYIATTHAPLSYTLLPLRVHMNTRAPTHTTHRICQTK